MPSQPLDADNFLDVIAHAPADRPFVVAQLGQSLDGRIATPSGASRWINGDGALDHLHRLRAVVDAVVVGCGTVLADDPQLTVRRVGGRSPARVVIDPNGRIGAGARIFADDGMRRLVVRAGSGAAPAGVEAVDVTSRDGRLSPADIVQALFERGFSKILIEGGASTVSTFIDARAVDRLHVLLAPMILGSGVAGLSLKPIKNVSEALKPLTRIRILDGGDVLFDCDLSQSL